MQFKDSRYVKLVVRIWFHFSTRKSVCIYLFSLFWSQKLHCRGNNIVKLVACTCFCFFAYKSHTIEAAIPAIIVVQRQLCQQLVTLIICNCFWFSLYKNCDTGTVILTADKAGHIYLFSVFYLLKLLYRDSYASSWSSQLHIFVFAFLLIKFLMSDIPAAI